MQESPIIKFTYGERYKGLSAYVEQLAVFRPIAARLRPGPGCPTTRRVKFVRWKQQEVWEGLRKIGRCTEDFMLSLCNCRPTGVRAIPRTYSCRHTSLCPFCWARRAVKLWRRVDCALFPTQKNGKGARSTDCSLILISRKVNTRDLHAFRKDGIFDLVACLDARAARRKGVEWPGFPQRAAEHRAYSRYAIGSLDGTLVYPSRVAGVVIETRQVLVVPRGKRCQIPVHPGQVVRRVDNLTRKKLAHAMGWYSRYPATLLRMHGETTGPLFYDTYLQAVRSRRMFMTYGILYHVVDSRTRDLEMQQKVASEKKFAIETVMRGRGRASRRESRMF